MFIEIDFETMLFFDVDSVLRTYFFLMMAVNSLMVVFFEEELHKIGSIRTLIFLAFSPIVVFYKAITGVS